MSAIGQSHPFPPQSHAHSPRPAPGRPPAAPPSRSPLENTLRNTLGNSIDPRVCVCVGTRLFCCCCCCRSLFSVLLLGIRREGDNEKEGSRKKIKEQGEATKGERRETEKEEDEEEEEAEKKNGETLSGSDHKNRNSCSSHLHNGSSCTKRPITDSSRPTKATVNVEEATLALQRDITVKDP